MRRLRAVLAALAFFSFMSSPTLAGVEPACRSSAFTVDDYFNVKRIGDMAMTRDRKSVV